MKTNRIALSTASLLISIFTLAQKPELERRWSNNDKVFFDTVTHTVHLQMRGINDERINQFYDQNLQNSNLTTGKTSISNFHLTKDINASKSGAPYSDNFVLPVPNYPVINNVMYFSADDGTHGVELWRSDGTGAGTSMVKDIEPGEGSSLPYFAIAGNDNKLYFTTRTSQYGTELWVSDGTEEGTHVVKDIAVGSSSSNIFMIYPFGNSVYFVTNGNYYNDVLWKTDGTDSGTQIVKEFYTPDNNYAHDLWQFTVANGLLYFTADDILYGRQLWRSDGTPGGTYILRVNSGDGDYGGPNFLTSYDNHLYFVATDGTTRKLWLTDGTASGTVQAPGGNGITFTDNRWYLANVPFAVTGNTMYFNAYSYTTGLELYKYNASDGAGIVLVKDMNPGSNGSDIDAYNMIVVRKKLFFPVHNGDDTYTVWTSDGTSANTQAIKSTGPKENPYSFTDGFGTLFFGVYDSTFGYEPWKSDGTDTGTVLLKDISPGSYSSLPVDFTPLRKKVYFGATTLKKGTELWSTTGTNAGTVQVKDINRITSGSSYPGGWPYMVQKATLGNGIVFIAGSPKYGRELYRSDGTSTGTRIIADMVLGELDNAALNFLTKNSLAYFSLATYSSNGHTVTICKTDGKTVTKLTVTNSDSYFINSLAVADSGLVFYQLYNWKTQTEELWRTDGTEGGTYMLTNNLPYSENIIALGNTAFFIGSDASSGNELWSSNGTVIGTQRVKDINPGSFNSAPYSFFIYKNEVYFAAFDGITNGLWKSDGTTGGTVKVADVQLASERSSQKLACISGNYLYFNGNTSNYGYELWRTDGTTGGTLMVADINPGAASSNPFDLTDVNGTLFFAADDGSNGIELWRSRGKDTNTKMVNDITKGPDSTLFDDLCNANGKLFFNVNGGLWISDGTANGTFQLQDSSIANVANIMCLISNGTKLFFSGYTYQYGQELYEGDINAATFNRSKSVTEIKSVPSFTAIIYPNPTSSVTILSLSGNVKNVIISITDVRGHLSWQEEFHQQTRVNLPMEKLVAGVYFVSVKSGGGIRTIKVVKE